MNLAKFRKAQQQLEEAEERTKLAESHMTRLGAGERGGLSLLVRKREIIFGQKNKLERCLFKFYPFKERDELREIRIYLQRFGRGIRMT